MFQSPSDSFGVPHANEPFLTHPHPHNPPAMLTGTPAAVLRRKFAKLGLALSNRFPPILRDHRLVMDSLPQETIDKIIDSLPSRSSLRSSSLVAKLWRKRSQQRALHTILFLHEFTVNRWHVHTQSDPDGARSYIQRVGFSDITEWKNPALFGCLLGNFSSLRSLQISNTEIPNGMLEHISHGGLRETVTALHIRSM